MRQGVAVFAVSLLLIPAASFAQVSIVQDSCVIAGEDLVIWFSVVNSSESYVCSFQLIPETIPLPAECVISAYGPVEVWAGWLRNDGGAGYAAPPHEPPRLYCIPAGGSLGGFSLTIPLEPSTCCYKASFCNELIDVIHEEQSCFSCAHIGTGEPTWGEIKQHYRE